MLLSVSRCPVRSDVVVVLIGRDTDSDKEVHLQVERALHFKKAFVAVRIHRLPNALGATDTEGKNILGRFSIEGSTGNTPLSENSPCYDWVEHRGSEQIGTWIRSARLLCG